MKTDDKVRENRLRRWAKRLGFALQKSRVREPHIDDLGDYRIFDTVGHWVAAGSQYELDLDGVEKYLAVAEKQLRATQRGVRPSIPPTAE